MRSARETPSLALGLTDPLWTVRKFGLCATDPSSKVHLSFTGSKLCSASPQQAGVLPSCHPPPRMSSSAGSTKGGVRDPRQVQNHTISSPLASTVHVIHPAARHARKWGPIWDHHFPTLEFGVLFYREREDGYQRGPADSLLSLCDNNCLHFTVAETPRLREIKGTTPKHTAS